MPAGLQGVLWDMDGTLVDTEPYWFKAEKRLVAEFGGEWTDAQATALVGNALPVSARILQQAGVDFEVREIVDRLLASVIEQVHERIPWRPGARELLAELQHVGVPCGMVTMSEKSLAAEIVAQLPADTFRFLVTGDMVATGKPDPEPYLLGVELLRRHVADATPERIVAVEDSLPGVASALAAGTVTIGVPNVVELPRLSGLTIWPTLEGRTVEDLEGLVCASLAADVVA